MKTTNSIFSRLAAIVLVLAMLVSLASCGKDPDGDNGGQSPTGEPTAYTVTVKTAGGMAMSDIDVYIYTDSSRENMQDFAKTNAEGTANFNLPQSDSYAIVLSGVKKGYTVAESYAFEGTNAVIKLTSSLITDEDLSSATLGLGDVMYDFTVTTPAGKEIKLSEMLKEKELVVLNFWYTTCTWCLEEFPLMEQISKEYADKAAFIALNPMEDNNAVDGFQKQYGYTFTMAACPSSWSNTFSVSGYPTSVFVDRYGVICLVEAGAITSKRPFVCAFDHFTAENYAQKLCENGIGDLVTQVKPSYTMDTSEAISKLINSGTIDVTYRPETEDENAEYIWPFIAGKKLGADCIYASNIGIDSSYAIMYADVTMKAGQALCFDYVISSERLCDILYVIVDDEDVYQISGVAQTEVWQTCYPWVAEEDGTYEVALCFMKDGDGAEGDDTVYIDNMRIADASAINVPTYLPSYAATTKDDGDTYTYATVVYNEADGYYHVGTADGPLLLADLMNYTPFNEEQTVQEIVINGDADKDGISLYNKVEEGGAGMVKFFSYASNSTINGVCTVTKELADMLKQVADIAGFDGDENEWLKMCKYYKAYGTNGGQLADPIKGLAPFCAFETTLGKDVDTNYFYYDRAIIPRGLMSEFIPSTSGVYRFTSKSDYQDGIDAWIFNENSEVIYTYEHDERMYTDTINCSMVYYMEAGKKYYINMAFWDIYATGTIPYDVEYLGATYDLFRLAAPGYFTYDSDATGSQMYDIITGGITPELKDGYYYEKDGGSAIYADFEGLTTMFSQTITQMIDMGGFDFTKSETDGEILAYLKQNGNDADKTKEYLKKLWGEEYDQNAEVYQLEDVLEGRYHGNGQDYTEEMRGYLSKVLHNGGETEGCVKVDERLAELLQMLMSKYTFEDVENSWLKVCYYYDYLGA
ncbi:MAG: TlpA family protein disulfide reductase [Ruminococcaceae bacterium]|nr:TlpA family protein disulfide reductase [Oscillospiraceae bacterium]